MPYFDYQQQGYGVSDAVAEVHRSSWQNIAGCGHFFNGEQRIAIAQQARASRAQRDAAKWLRKNLPDTPCLNKTAVQCARIIGADAHQIDKSWAQLQIAEIGAAAYVELGSIVVTVTAIDAFNEAIGRAHENLPEPQVGVADGEFNQDVTDAGAYVPMVDPWPGPNVSRAMSLVSDANALFMANVAAMYTGASNNFNQLVWQGPLSRPQIELLAARVSSMNECFY